ncbi:MAG: hypothetical protein V4487_01165 [Chlamydiota bacterium]
MKKIALLLFLETAVFSQEITEAKLSQIESHTPVPVQPPDPEKSFTYLGMGATGLFLPLVPDIAVGYRDVNKTHVWDRSIGFCALPSFITGYIQNSYLYFPVKSSGFYLGAGLTVGFTTTGVNHALSGSQRMAPYINLPLTVGHQFEDAKKYRFIQFQITPLMTTSISYGMGF